ncbi:uncharacterized protein LOC144666803 [Oculina patagonica]
MARTHRRQMKPLRYPKLSRLSSDVLCVRLQALHLPTSGSRIRLLKTLKFPMTADVTHPASLQSRTSFGRVTTSSRSTSSVRQRQKAHRHARDEFTAQSPLFTLEQNGLKPEQNCPFDTGLPTDDLFESPVESSGTDDTVLTPNHQLFVIQATASSSVKVALANLQCSEGQSVGVANPQTQNHRAQSSMATPLGLKHQLDKSVEEKIFRGMFIEPFDRV